MPERGYLAENDGGLLWGRLLEGVLLRRYMRFLAEVRLRNGRRVIAHCPNTGSMKACSEPGRPVWLSRQDDPKRKLKYTWEIIRMPDSMVGVNTGVPNRLVKAGIVAGRVEELAGYETARPEVAIGNHTRLDLVLEGQGRRTCYIEIKNCTLVENGVAMFPDAVTDRGRKHLDELARLKGEGGRSVIFFLIQRMDAGTFRPADHIDPEYGRVLREAVLSGVEPIAYDVEVTLDRIALRNSVPVEL